MHAMEFNKVFDVISYLYSELNNTAPIAFWSDKREVIFSKLRPYMFLRRDNVDMPGVYYEMMNGLVKHDLGIRYDLAKSEEFGAVRCEMRLLGSDPEVKVEYAASLGWVYPVCMHATKDKMLVYADEKEAGASIALQRFTELDIEKPYFSAFKRLYEMDDVPVEVIGAISRGGEIQDIYELYRLTTTGEERKRDVMHVHAHNLANGWDFILLEVIDKDTHYKPNIVMWYHHTEPGRYPHTDFHLLDALHGGLV